MIFSGSEIRGIRSEQTALFWESISGMLKRHVVYYIMVCGTLEK